MSVKTLQITLSGATQQVSSTPIKCKWVTFQNNGNAAGRVGDANTTGSRGTALAASGGIYSPPVSTVSTFGTDLSQWYVIGATAQVIDVTYDDMNF